MSTTTSSAGRGSASCDAVSGPIAMMASVCADQFRGCLDRLASTTSPGVMVRLSQLLAGDQFGAAQHLATSVAWQRTFLFTANSIPSADQKELYYLTSDWKLMAVDITTSNGFQAATPRLLFQVPQGLGVTAGGYTIDGRRRSSNDAVIRHADPVIRQPGPHTWIQTIGICPGSSGKSTS
jgi:hypothetical protein